MKARLRRLVTQGDKSESCFHEEEEQQRYGLLFGLPFHIR